MSEVLVTGFWWWLCTLVYGVAMIVALYRSPWKRLFAHRVLQHLFLGLTVLLIGLWQMRAGLSPGLTIHVLGATMAALIFGWELGLLCLSLVLAAMTVVGRETWQAFPINAFVTCMIPVLVSYGHHLLIRRFLPKNFFVYFLATVFLGAILSVFIAALMSVFLLWINEAYSVEKLIGEYLIFLPLMMLSEGVVNGMLMAGLVTNHPDLIRTFGSKAYIDGH